MYDSTVRRLQAYLKDENSSCSNRLKIVMMSLQLCDHLRLKDDLELTPSGRFKCRYVVLILLFRITVGKTASISLKIGSQKDRIVGGGA